MIYLATPISCFFKNGLFCESAKISISHLLNLLREKDLEVQCAIENENWGKEVSSIKNCIKADFDLVKNSDLVLALPINSYGVHMELGWASALNKPIIVINNFNYTQKTPLINELSELTSFKQIFMENSGIFPSTDDWDKKIKYIYNSISEMI